MRVLKAYHSKKIFGGSLYIVQPPILLWNTCFIFFIPKKGFSCCTALPRVEFLSNPRRIHSEEEDEEKGEQGLPRALICCSPAPPPFPPHTARMLHCLGLRYQDIPPPHSTFLWTKISDFQEKRQKSMTASF